MKPGTGVSGAQQPCLESVPPLSGRVGLLRRESARERGERPRRDGSPCERRAPRAAASHTVTRTIPREKVVRPDGIAVYELGKELRKRTLTNLYNPGHNGSTTRMRPSMPQLRPPTGGTRRFQKAMRCRHCSISIEREWLDPTPPQSQTQVAIEDAEHIETNAKYPNGRTATGG